MNIYDSVEKIKGVGPKKAEALNKLGIETVSDLLFYYPRLYQDRRNICPISQLESGRTVLIRAQVVMVISNGYRFKKAPVRLLVRDASGSMEIVFFNGSYMAKAFKKGDIYDFYGNVSVNRDKFQMVHPEFSLVMTAAQKAAGAIVNSKGEGILPIYRLTSGISQNEIRKYLKEVSGVIAEIPDYMPRDILERDKLADLSFAVENIHYPKDEQSFKSSKIRLIFDEFFLMQLALMSIRSSMEGKKDGIAFDKKVDVNEFTDSLTYPLTGAQKRVCREIMADMESSHRMNRLIQGDVGCGKTAIAEVAIFKAVRSGYQAAFMAPTEILAGQHFKSLSHDFEKFGITVALLTGSMSQKDKNALYKEIEAGLIDVIVGTHALISEAVKYKNLGLVITDEQHRFGVNQRAMLSAKGENADIMVMTATPIPRTLAVVLYGDLDVSIIDELPPGRQEIITKALTQNAESKAYDFLRSEISKGRQAYIVCPLIEDSDVVDAKSAESTFEELQGKFPEFSLALLHGQMSEAEKDDVMRSFYAGDIDILVSTVVIEVGINVPNATVMLIENSERFGLSQMHQLRGRVGRGGEQSYCILITDGQQEIAKERAKIMCETSDGFVIAEKDLQLRGPGEFFGTRQHGLPELKIADFIKHEKILAKAKEEAKAILEDDPKLIKHELLREKISKNFDITL